MQRTVPAGVEYDKSRPVDVPLGRLRAMVMGSLAWVAPARWDAMQSDCACRRVVHVGLVVRSAYTVTDPHRALDIFREGLAYTRQHPIPFFEALIARNSAGLEASHGDNDQALDMFTTSIDSFHQSGDTVNLAVVFAHLTVFFDRTGRPEIAAIFCGTTTNNPAATLADGFAATVDHLRDILDTDTFDTCARTGAAMTITEAVHYAHHHLDDTRQQRT